MDSLALGVQDGFSQVWPLGSLCWRSGLQGLHIAFSIRWSQWGGWLTYGECCRDSASQGWAALRLYRVGQDSLLRFVDREHGTHHSTEGLPKTSQPWWATFCSCWKHPLLWFQWWIPKHVLNAYGTTVTKLQFVCLCKWLCNLNNLRSASDTTFFLSRKPYGTAVTNPFYVVTY